MDAIAKWTVEARRRGGVGIARISRWLTMAAGVVLTRLPAGPSVAAQWGQRTEPAARASAAVAQPSPPVAVKPIPLPPPAVVAAAPQRDATAPPPAPPDSIE